MTEEWERITALFGAARLLDPDQRTAFLDVACGENASLRDEVERLLAESHHPDSFLEEPAWPGPVSLAALTSPLVVAGELLKARSRIETTVASGGQALVYRATDTLLSRPVIIKVLRTSGRQSQQLKTAFEREMNALSHIDHPGVIGIFDVGELADGCPFLVIQYINGVSLRDELQKGPLEAWRAARLLLELASALSAAHAAGLAHRDLKPENVMLQRFDDGSETLKLIDFGIARLYQAPTAASVVVAGTIRYMAPEQFHGADSPACDVYALALVVCEMLCGHPDSRALPPSTNPATKRQIESALAFRPEERPRDVRRWSERLAAAIVSGDRVRFGQRWIAAAALIVLVAATGASRTLWSHPQIPAVSRQPAAVNARASNAAASLTGEWTITGILGVCGFLCGSPVGTVYHSTATLTQDSVTSFHGTYFGYPIKGEVSGTAIAFGFDSLPDPPLVRKGDCAGTIAGTVITVNCSEYLRPDSSSNFLLNGSRLDTVVKR